jgi:hypothetical protein
MKYLVIGNMASVQALAAAIATLTPEQYQDLAQEILDLSAEAETAKAEAETAKAEAETAKAEAETATSVNDELQKQVTELSQSVDLQKVKQGEMKKTPSIVGKSFELNGQKYGFNFPKMTWKKSPITVDTVLADAALQAQLVAAKSTMIKEISE